MKKYCLLFIIYLYSTTVIAAEHSGESLIQTLCASCHTAAGQPRIAPPVFAVIKRVKQQYPDREDFISQIAQWVNEPTAEQALMPCAIEKFGIMPKLNYKEQDVRTIAAYWYDSDVASPGKHGSKQGKQGASGSNGCRQ